MSEKLFHYIPTIPHELEKMHDEALSKEFRWLGGGLIFSDRPESDLDHVKSMERKHNEEVSELYPVLFSEVDNEDTSPMIKIHDTGEIIPHDLAHFVPNYEIIRPKVKHQERVAFRFLTGKYIDDRELRAYLRNIYSRYDKNIPDDKVSQYVHLLDKVQAIDFGAVYVFPARKILNKEDRQQQVNHIFEKLVEPATNLFSLISTNAQNELSIFMDSELMVLRENGYAASEVDPYRGKFNQVFEEIRK